MKKSVVTSALIILLALSVLVTAVLSCWYVQSIRQLRRLQGQVPVVNKNRNLTQALLNEAVEYSRKNPAMETLLKSMSQQQQATARPAVQPINGVSTNRVPPP